MMNGMMNCASGGWLMITSGILYYGVVALSVAALAKYLFFEDRSATTQ
jgi:hypothetical protein